LQRILEDLISSQWRLAMTTLYAWATPAFGSGSPVDHTWVTDYDNRVTPYNPITAVIAAGANDWFCWGSFHDKGDSTHHPGGSLGSATGNLAMAKCLCTPNLPSGTDHSTCGSIYTYGIDGVCHQLANQILWASGSGGTTPLTVAKARGYVASTFLYGTYGLQHAAWAARKAHCAVPPSGGMAIQTMREQVAPDDDFAAHAQKTLASLNAEHKVAALLELRQQLHAEQHAVKFTLATGVWTPSAEALNERNNAYLERAKSLLTPTEFEAVFGFPPSEKINLVDPTVPNK
jgi:hypothetical protein